MSEMVWAAYCAICCVATLVLLLGAAVARVSAVVGERRKRRYTQLYMPLIAERMLCAGSSPLVRFPMSGRRGAKAVLAHLLSEASASTCFEEPGALRRMVAANGIEGWLLRRARLSRKCARAGYLAMLSALPVSHATAVCVRRYRSSGGITGFRTMLVEIAAEPQSAVRILESYPYVLTPFEMAELTSMLRRGMVPLAYGPLLSSPNRNLRMLGLNIVRIFGIAEAQHRLTGIVADPQWDGEFGDEALGVMVSLHMPVSEGPAASRIRSMPPSLRRALLRRLVREGYSAEAVLRLASRDERPYVESLAASYKRSLICHFRF